MKKIIATILALTLVFTATVASVSFAASAKEETVAAHKFFMEALGEELDPDDIVDIGDIGDIDDIDVPDMTLDEFIASITPENASETLKALYKDVATILYTALGIDEDAPEMKTATDYVDYQIKCATELKSMIEGLKKTVANLTEDDFKALVDDMNAEADEENKITVDDVKELLSDKTLDEGIEQIQLAIEDMSSYKIDENLDANAANLLELEKLLAKCSDDLSVKYSESVYDKFSEQYPDAQIGDIVAFDDDYEFDGSDAFNAYDNNYDSSYALQLYVDKANITKNQYATLKEIKALLGTFSDDLVEMMNQNEVKNYDTLTAEVDEYIAAYEAKGDNEPADTTKKDDSKKDNAATTATAATEKYASTSDDVNTGAATAPISAAVVMVMAGAAMIVARKRK